jgi:DNA-binding NtrC family response regulator
MRQGAFDFLTKPFQPEVVRATAQRAAERTRLLRENELLKETVGRLEGTSEILGESQAIRDLREKIGRVATTNATVLITGETGTGKELVARAIHRNSSRSGKPFVAVNCAAVTETLLESELFGHEKGAFTGAVARREGKFEAADGGTLFLDEIGDMSLETQAKLLRVIQEKRFERIGGNQSLVADVRIIAATNQNLEAMAADGRFREDLYYRIKVVEVRVPPLRERREDIAPLAMHFLDEACKQFGTPHKTLTPEAMRACVENPWRGNVRSLKAAIEQAVILSSGAEITLAELLGGSASGSADAASNHDAARMAVAGVTAETPGDGGEVKFREAKEKFVGQWERDFFINALRATGGNISRAAERAGMYRQNFQQKMRELGISVDDLGLKTQDE